MAQHLATALLVAALLSTSVAEPACGQGCSGGNALLQKATTVSLSQDVQSRGTVLSGHEVADAADKDDSNSAITIRTNTNTIIDAPKLVIHFVRHAEVHNPEDVKYGRMSGFKLSSEGLLNAQGPGAERLAKARQNVQDALRVNKTSGWFVSPMLRTRQTAAAVAAGQPDFKEINSELFMSSVVDSQLNEVLVPHQGKKFNPSIDYFARDEVNQPGEGFETFVDVLRRMQSFVRGLLHDPNHIGTQVVAVSHSECILAVRLWASNATEKILAADPTIPEGTGVERPGFVSVTTVVFPYERPMDNLKWLQ